MTLSRFIQIIASCLRGTAMPVFAAFTLATISGLVLAQAEQAEFRACRGIADNSARLACYDGLAFAEEPVKSSTASPAPAADAPAQAAMADVTVRSFGTRPSRVEASSDGEAELVDTVTAIEELSKGKVRITLSSGQIWTQSISKSFFLREQDAVRISRSPWGGSFRLHKDGKPGYIQVERLR